MTEATTTHETTPEPSNPYVGPQQFEAGHADYYFGRDREARDLLSVVIAHRVVLFYAPSGAGKSSLLKVRLIPGLRSKEVRYLVLPVARVGGAPSADVGVIDNIFAFNAMSSIDGRGDMSGVFSRLTLKEFMRGLRTSDGQVYSYDADVAAAQAEQKRQEAAKTPERPRRAQPPHVLILDQFEEVVTTHPTRWPEREKFFDQLNEALEDDPQLWVVLSMRADYVSEIERYAPRLPNYPFVRFAMERMDKAAASEAVAKPAAKAGRPIEADAVEEIVHNLLLVREQGKDTQANEGAFVQPVQLQVVCYQMWEGLRNESGPTITIDNLTKLAGGDLTRFVDNALGDFYEIRLRLALDEVGAGVSEAELRDWFSHKLITEAGTRGFLYKGETKTEGLPNPVVELLENKYLLRAEARAGGYWYELVHDRFIDPIRARNNKWRLEQLQINPLLRRAHEWAASHPDPARRDESRLLSDDELRNLDVNRRALEPAVHEFVEASQRAMEQRQLEATQRQLSEEKKRTEAEKRTSRRLRWAVGLAIFMAVSALVAWLVVFRQAGELETKNKELTTANANLGDAVATADASAAAEKAAKEEAVTANKIAESVKLANQSLESPAIEDRLLLARAAATYSTTLLARTALLAALDDSYRVDGRMTAYAPHERLALAGSPWESLAFNHDGSLLALGDERGGVTLWDNAGETPIGQRLTANEAEYPVYALAFDPTGPRLVSATGVRDNPTAAKHDLVLWDLTDPETPASTVLAANQPAIWSVAWSPDGRRLAVANQDGTVSLWDMSASPPMSRTLPDRHTDWAYSVAFDPTGERLASAGKDGVIILWSELASRAPVAQILTDHREWVNIAVFSPGGAHLASGSDDGTLRLWDLTEDPPSSMVVDDHSDVGAEVWDLSFAADGGLLVAGWGDNVARVYDLEGLEAAPWNLAGHGGEVTRVAFDPAAPQRLISIGALGDETIAWDLSEPSAFVSVQPFSAPVTPAVQVFSPNGRWLATASADGRVVVSDRETNHPVLSLTAGMTITTLALNSNVSQLALAGCEKLLHETPSNDSSSSNTQNKTPDADQSAASAAPKLAQCKLTLWPLDSQPAITPTMVVTFPQPIFALAFHPQETDQVAIGLESGDVQTYNFLTSVATNLSPRVPEIVDLAFSSDGLSLAGLGKSGVVKIWDWSRRELVDESQPTEEGGQFDAIEFLRDDDWVAIASGAPQLELWERGTWAIVKKFGLDAGRAADLVYDWGEGALFVLQPDKLARWPMDEATWMELACARAGRNLSYDAWRVAFPTAKIDETQSALICPEDQYPLHITFAETLVKEARKVIDDCTQNQLDKGVKLLQQAAEMKVDPPIEIDWMEVTLAVLSEQAWDYLRQPSHAYSDQAGACLELAAEQLKENHKAIFDPSLALQAGQLLVRAESRLADPQSDAGPIIAALEGALGMGAPWPDSSLQDQIWRLLPQAAYRLCQQGDNEGCRRFAETVELMESGDEIVSAFKAGVDESLYFMGRRGQGVTIAMNAENNAFDTLLRLEGPDPASSADDASNDDDGPDNNSLIANILLPKDGIYRIIPTAYSGEGSYRLSLDVKTPRSITVGATESSSTAQDSLWQFEGRAGQLTAIALNDQDPNFDPWLRLMGPDLAPIKTDYDSGGNLNALIIATLPTSGTYFVGAEPVGSSAPYTLRIAEPRPLPYDQPQRSSLISETLWVVDADRSQAISMTVTSGGSGAAPRLALLSMDGVPLQETSSSVSTTDMEHIPAQIAPQDGGFIVHVSAQNERAPYTLTLTSITPPTLTVGEPVTSTTQITTLWMFTGAAGQIVDISLNIPRPAIEPGVEILHDGGSPITALDSSSGSRNARVIAALPTDGQYFVRPQLANSPVPYTLVMTEVTLPLIAAGEPFTATLGQYTLLALDGVAGQPIDVLLTSAIGDLASVALLTDDGQPLRDMTSSRIDDFILPQTGRYYLKVGGELDQNTEYALLLADATTRSIRPGETFTTTTASDTLWSMEITKGQALDIAMTTSDPSFLPALTVYAPDGAVLSPPTDGSAYPNVRIKGFIAPTTGRYILHAGPIDSPAEYILSVGEAPAPRINFGETQTSNTQTNELWRFTGRAGQVIAIDLSGWVPGVFDPFLTLLAGDGSTLMETDDINSNDDYNARIARFVLPESGDYFIRSGRPGFTAPYWLSLSEYAPAPVVLGSTIPMTQSNAYTLNIEQPVFVQVAADGPVDLLLVGPDGDALIDHAPSMLRRLEVTGTYTLGVVLPSNSLSRALTIAAIPTTPSPLEIDGENRGNLSPGLVDLWRFSADDIAGVRLAVQPTDAFTPLLSLWTSGGELVGTSQVGSLIAPLPASDDFWASISAQDAQAGGVYTLTIQPAQTVLGPQACTGSSTPADYAPLHPGSIVLLGRHRPVNGDESWNRDMDAYVGRPARVLSLVGAVSAGCPAITVDVDQGRFWWRVRDMTTVE